MVVGVVVFFFSFFFFFFFFLKYSSGSLLNYMVWSLFIIMLCLQGDGLHDREDDARECGQL